MCIPSVLVPYCSVTSRLRRSSRRQETGLTAPAGQESSHGVVRCLCLRVPHEAAVEMSAKAHLKARLQDRGLWEGHLSSPDIGPGVSVLTGHWPWTPCHAGLTTGQRTTGQPALLKANKHEAWTRRTTVFRDVNLESNIPFRSLCSVP